MMSAAQVTTTAETTASDRDCPMAGLITAASGQLAADSGWAFSRTFPARADQVGQARAFLRSVLADCPAADDVLSALVNLGYQRSLAQKAIAASIAKDKAVADNFEALFRAAMAGMR